LSFLLLPHREQKVADRAIGDLAAVINALVNRIAKMKSL
jgi:hypothetical protein